MLLNANRPVVYYSEACGRQELLASGRTGACEAYFFVENALSSLLLTATGSQCEAQSRPLENAIVLGLGVWEGQRRFRVER